MVVKKGGKLAGQCTGVFNMIDECKHGVFLMYYLVTDLLLLSLLKPENAVFYPPDVATRARPSAPPRGALCAE